MDRKEIHKIANDAVANGEPSSWFETLYSKAKGNPDHVPWADLKPNLSLQNWIKKNPIGSGRALVVGCGLGDDAEALAKSGYHTTAFDVSPSAVEWCRTRFPESHVSYQVQDLFDLPTHWKHHFDFIFEAYTIQALPPSVRTKAVQAVTNCVAPRGQLLVECTGLLKRENWEGPPWPLTKDELNLFTTNELKQQTFDVLKDPTFPDASIFVSLFH